MNVNDLTLGQLKELQSIFVNNQISKKQIGDQMLGKCCMFRTYSAGVHFGILKEKDGQTCLVENAQRVHYWVKACSLSQLAMEGSKDFSGCRISVPVDQIILEQVIEIIPMPDSTVKAFREAAQWKS